MALSVDDPVVKAVAAFGEAVAPRFATGLGEPEDQLRGPFEMLLTELGRVAGNLGVVTAGEAHLAEERVRPDYAITVDNALIGFVEVKAPGKGADPTRYSLCWWTWSRVSWIC